MRLDVRAGSSRGPVVGDVGTQTCLVELRRDSRIPGQAAWLRSWITPAFGDGQRWGPVSLSHHPQSLGSPFSFSSSKTTGPKMESLMLSPGSPNQDLISFGKWSP